MGLMIVGCTHRVRWLVGGTYLVRVKPELVRVPFHVMRQATYEEYVAYRVGEGLRYKPWAEGDTRTFLEVSVD